MADSPTGNPYNPIITQQQYPTVMLASGTVGTNDVSGTAEPIRWGGNPATGAGYVEVVGGVSVTGGSNVNVVSGTQQTLGTVGTVLGIGTITNFPSLSIASGSIFGTILGGTIGNIDTGTITRVVSVGTVAGFNSGTVTTGSLTNLASLHSGTVNVGTFVQPSGTVTAIVAGTQNTLGTVGVVNNLVTGTIASARIDHRPVGSSVLPTHTLGTGGGTTVGTIIAPVGAGTNLYISSVSLIVHSGTVDCGIANNVAGTTGAGVLTRGAFVPSAGITVPFIPPINLGANGTLAYFMISPGTVSFTANYWVAP